MCPLKAINADTNEIVLAHTLTEADRGKHFKCYACEFLHKENSDMTPVLPKEDIIQHFRHKVKTEHGNEPETTQHLQAKQHVYNKFKALGYEVDVEHWISEEGEAHEIDVYAELQGVKYAIECQYSAISTETIEKRNEFYERHGMNTIWVLVIGKYYNPLDTDKYNKTPISKSERCITENNGRLFYLNVEPTLLIANAKPVSGAYGQTLKRSASFDYDIVDMQSMLRHEASYTRAMKDWSTVPVVRVQAKTNLYQLNYIFNGRRRYKLFYDEESALAYRREIDKFQSLSISGMSLEKMFKVLDAEQDILKHNKFVHISNDKFWSDIENE